MSNEYFLHNALAVWSLMVGAFLCAVYDVFRLFRLRRKQNFLLLFFCDILFCLFATICFLLLFFNLSYGRMRLYAFALSVIGFLIWRFTVSRFVMMLLLKILMLAEKLLNSIKMRISAKIKRILRYIYTKRYCKTAIKKVETKGFIK